MKIRILFLVVLLWSCFLCNAQNMYFPPNTGNTWDTISPASMGWCTSRIDSLYQYLEDKNTKGFILLKDGEIVLEKYFGTFTQDSLWYWASAGKTLTGFMIGIAQQENFLSLQDTSSKYLGNGWTTEPFLKEKKITIWNQLTMTTGLDDGVSDNHCTDDTCLKYIADAGTRWAYHNAPYTLLDKVIEASTGQTLNSYVTQKIKNTTGISGSFFKTGYDNVFVSNARSMARFGLLLLNKGKWNNTVLLSDTAYFNQMTNSSQQLNKSYGYLTWLNGKSSYMVPTLQYVFNGKLNPNAPDDVFMALGKNGQLINVCPSKKIVFIRMGNAPGAGDVPFTMNDTIWQKLNTIMCTNVSIETLENSNIEIVIDASKNQIQIENNNQETINTLELIDITGKTVLIMQHNTIDKHISIPFSNNTRGFYILSLSTDKGKVIKKIILP